MRILPKYLEGDRQDLWCVAEHEDEDDEEADPRQP